MFKHFPKQLLSLLCAGVCVCAVSAPAMAAELPNSPVEQLELRMTNIASTQCGLDIGSDGTAVINTSVTGKSNTTKCKIVLKMQVKNGSSWITVESWTVEKNSRTVSTRNTMKTESGKTYRAQATMTVWMDGVAETKTVTSASKTA